MKIIQLFDDEDLSLEIIKLLKDLDQHFFIENLDERQLDIRQIYVDLKIRPGSDTEQFPVKLNRIVGTIDLSESSIKNFENFPAYTRRIILSHTPSLTSLTASRQVHIFRLELTGMSGLKNLQNSGTFSTSRMKFSNCPNLTSFAGLEKITPFLDNGYVHVHVEDCNNVGDDPMNYAHLPVRFTFESTPEKMPIVSSMVSTRGIVAFADVGTLFDRYPILQEYYGKGAKGVLPLTKYFKSIKEPWRAANIS